LVQQLADMQPNQVPSSFASHRQHAERLGITGVAELVVADARREWSKHPTAPNALRCSDYSLSAKELVYPGESTT